MTRYRVVKDEYPSDKYGIAVMEYRHGEWAVKKVIAGITEDETALRDLVSICNVLHSRNIEMIVADFKICQKYLDVSVKAKPVK